MFCRGSVPSFLFSESPSVEKTQESRPEAKDKKDQERKDGKRCQTGETCKEGKVKFWGKEIEDSQKPSGSFGVPEWSLKGFMDPTQSTGSD